MSDEKDDDTTKEYVDSVAISSDSQITIPDFTINTPGNYEVTYVGTGSSIISEPIKWYEPVDINLGDVPVDLSKIKSFEDFLEIIKEGEMKITLPEGKTAYKYATKEYLKENRQKASPLGQVLNGEDEE